MKQRVLDYVTGAAWFGTAQVFVSWVWWHCPVSDTLFWAVPVIVLTGWESCRHYKP